MKWPLRAQRIETLAPVREGWKSSMPCSTYYASESRHNKVRSAYVSTKVMLSTMSPTFKDLFLSLWCTVFALPLLLLKPTVFSIPEFYCSL